MSNIDYCEYTLKELYEARLNVNKEAYPHNAEMIEYWIGLKEGVLPPETPPPLKKVTIRQVVDTETKPDKEEIKIPIAPLPPPGDLPFLKVIKDAITTTWDKKRILLRALLLPYLLVFFLEYIHEFIVLQSGGFAALGSSLVQSIFYAMFAVSCHRAVLLGSDSIPRLGVLIPGLREFRFWGMTLVMGIIIMVLSIIATIPMSLVGFDPEVFIAIVFIPGLYLMARLAILFPAIAVDKNPTLAWSWALTRENGLRLAALLMIPMLPAYAFHFFLEESESILVCGAVVLLSFIFTVIGIILISLSYQELSKPLEPTTEQ